MKSLPILNSGIVFIFVLFFSITASAQKCPNSFRAGVNYGFLTDKDDTGFLFYNQYNRCISKKFEISLGASYFNSTSYDDASNEFNSMKTYKMLDLSGGFKAFRTSNFLLKIGAGPSLRHRAELERFSTGADASIKTEFMHSKSFDYGYHAFFENDFFVTDELIIGARFAGFDYTEGSSLFSIGLSMAYQF